LHEQRCDENQRRKPPTISAASGGATSAPRKAKQMRVSGAQLSRACDGTAPLAVAGASRACIASVSGAVEAQQRFLAYAAHELRGEITVQLTLAELALADPNADTAVLREMGEGVVAACERQERLLEALLTLARSECGRLRREPIDLAATAAEVLRAHDHDGVRTMAALERARTIGDPQLVERVVANLVANAIRHNIPGGRVDIATYTAAGRATFTISNTGPVIPAGELICLFEPFQRRTSQAGPSAAWVGLGLAIVQAIADAHDATLTAQARTGGGLGIDVAFPALN
jgi:signal transduction histidine kinase